MVAIFARGLATVALAEAAEAAGVSLDARGETLDVDAFGRVALGVLARGGLAEKA